MKNLKFYILTGFAALALTSCNDFLTTVPKDAMSPSSTWKSQDDVEKFLTGCYDGWEDGSALLYWDSASDFAYNNFPWEGFRNIGNGSFSPSDPGWSFYGFTIIRRVNTLLENAEKATFSSDAAKKDIIAQARVIRAYRYFVMNMCYGGVPIIGNYTTAQEAQVPRETSDKVRDYVLTELNAAIPDLNTTPSERGRIAKGAALGIKMRACLYWGKLQEAKEAAQQIIDLGQYSLEPDYANLFKVSGQNSKEIILATQYISGTYSLYTVGQLYPNGDGGWSSVVPTQQCVDNYEMANGMTINEAGSGYDPAHPFHGRDPRLAMSIIYPGCDWNGRVFNSLDKKIDGSDNADYPTNADNASKTGLSWLKYLGPKSQYADMWDANCCPIVLRYADVLLTWAECENELNGPSAEVYKKINQVRNRAGMPNVDEAKYNTKEKLRELIRRERGSEFAGEGQRRWDILRWTTSDGKMLAEKVLNGTLSRITGTLVNSSTKDSSDPTMRATITPGATEVIETRTFKDYNKLFPIPQSNIDNNPKLEQNPGYEGAK